MRLKNSFNVVGENDQEDEQQEQAEEEVMSKKVVEKLVSSKKSKQVAVESELIPVDNDVHVSAYEEEAETVVKSYDLETHTLRMGDGRRIKVSRKLIHEILGVPIGENKVISLPSTTSEDITTTNWRYTTPFIEDRIHITRVDDHVSSLTANGAVSSGSVGARGGRWSRISLLVTRLKTAKNLYLTGLVINPLSSDFSMSTEVSWLIHITSGTKLSNIGRTKLMTPKLNLYLLF
ncbi:hypothetical protein Tco_0464110 [Tanacetum coccineum]